MTVKNRRGIGGRLPLPTMPTPCVLWPGRITAQGYGRVSLPGGAQAYAHRYVYELHLGPIPSGMTIDHICWVTACVNVDHMEVVTPAENVRRASERITHCPAGHPYDAANTRYYVQAKTGGVGRKCRACHRQWEAARHGRPV